MAKTPKSNLILASASPARAQLLSACGYSFVQIPSGASEPPRRRGQNVRAYVLALARKKAEAVAKLYPDAFVLGADTVAHIGPHVIGKAGHASGALKILSRLAGRKHRICTAICVITPARDGKPQRILTGTDETSVTFRKLTGAECRAYVNALEPFHCAGGYALQAGGTAIIQNLNGDPSTVVGLPMELTARLLLSAGHRI